MRTIKERLSARTIKSDGCWLWTGAVGSHGYGVIGTGPHTTSTTHRMAYILQNGPIPNGMMVLHKCDNRRCVNPSHLYIGTAKDNARDLWERGSPVAQIQKNITEDVEAKRVASLPRGASHSRPLAKLEESEVAKILESTDSQKAIATRFGVSQQLISKIKQRQYWRHVNAAS